MSKDATIARTQWLKRDASTIKSDESTIDAEVEKPLGLIIEELFRDHSGDVHRYLYGLCRSDADANDAMQDAFINMYKVLSRGGKIAQPRAWLVAVSKRLLINRLRKAQNDEAKHMEFTRLADTVFQGGKTTHEELEDRQRLRAAMAAISELSQRERQCLAARASGLKFREVSVLMNMDYRRCFDLWTGAIAKLRKVMKDRL